ncbi:MAG: hypothetical protein A3D47_02325 [Candidatus Colwellbacteria bacterium RIFCSPHIGHO2_02_FULL_43_15]|uniref:Uncharacterized protein n=1 Tax=Candidatus Colwellbacteria bacterium RIFCSPHIGHO2_02_FULL_43_15 TaxID=1797686 RepID=A0A1G1YYR3_9BACT|nr:MAG: hypothetical protein A3D47_02325 [Candidatus Colwellbacteria bacterium RIFCSPHIGHO2_02_FULL_43_15]
MPLIKEADKSSEVQVAESKICVHGKCTCTKPNWEKFYLSPQPDMNIFSWWMWCTVNCCGEAMARYNRRWVWKCKDCGGMSSSGIFKEKFVLCLCCGQNYDMDEEYDF